MDNKDFKKHLAALAHGQHHPEEHDGSPDASAPKIEEKTDRRKVAARKPKRGTK
jgi:hypothetical protein